MVTISVIIPAYNQGVYLGEAIQSVLNQTYQDFEIVVVDDGSTDNTREIAHSYSDPRVIYIYQKNHGLSGARNTGIRNSNSLYLTYLDSDDLFLPEKLDLLLAKFNGQPEFGLVAGQAVPIDENGNRIGKVFTNPLPEDPAILLLGNPLHVGSVMIRRDWQNRGGYFDEKLRSYEDWDMWLRLGLIGCKMGWVDKPVSCYRFHPDQMTRIGTQMTQATFAVLDKLYHIPGLPPSWLELRSQAYSQAYLRAAAQAYHAGDFVSAKNYLSQAVSQDPDLLSNRADRLANQFVAWTQLPKTRDPIGFLERIYQNLPDDLAVLKERRKRDLGQAAIGKAFEAFRQGDYHITWWSVLRGLRYCPGYFGNRGVRSILFRSSIRLMDFQR